MSLTGYIACVFFELDLETPHKLRFTMGSMDESFLAAVAQFLGRKRQVCRLMDLAQVAEATRPGNYLSSF